MPGLRTGTPDFLLQNPETCSEAPMSRMTGAVPSLPVYHRSADMENITLVFTPKSEVKVQSNGRRMSPRTAIRQ
jgi:hypothetical protein